MKQIRKRLTYANVMSTIAVFLVLGGASALAASQLGKNSVGSKQLKKNAVTTAKIKKNAVTGAKIKKDAVTGAKIKESTLGTVPSATLADSIPPAEATHFVGAAGEPAFENDSFNLGFSGPLKLASVGFYKDHEGIVHLEGIARVGKATGIAPIFTLPPGYRPAAGTVVLFEQFGESATLIAGSNTSAEGVSFDGKVIGESEKVAVLDGISFRAAS